MRRTILTLVALFLAVSAQAQSRYLESAAAAKRMSDGIVASIAAGNYPGAWKDMKPLSVIPPAEFEAFEAQFKSQAEGLLRRFGSTVGYELVREEPLGTSLVRYQYLVRHEKAPIRWTLVFYRAEKGWVMTDFKFDGNASSFFAGGV